VHVASGELGVNGQRLAAGDALKVSGEPSIMLESGNNAEVLLFDLS
jgi:redox-sensitive bicupin YhaK (pirin superfamily)